MDAEEAMEYEYEEITDTGVVLRERRAGYSTHGYDFDDATGTIIGCALEVHRILGPGFRELEDYVQALNYVKASGFKLGLLLNFGAARLQIKRLVN